MEAQGFGWALQELWSGRKVYRVGWNGLGQFIRMQFPSKGTKITLPYIYISTKEALLVPWVASQTDLLAFDWQLVEED
jgi:hypothetical protein